MRKLWLATLAATALLGPPAMAAPNFAAYDGQDSVTEGHGGTKITKDGVDFWTTGAPPHRYQILGVLTDRRGSGLFGGDVIGSPGVVAKVKELGGNGVVVLGSESEVRGAMVISGNVGIARTRTTQLMVVRYLGSPGE